MASIVIAGDTSGSVTISAPAIAGTPTLTLPTTSGTLVVTGGAQTVQFAAGSASTPSITFTGDTNTGIFSPAADTIAFTEGGVESMRIDSSGNVGIGTSSPASFTNFKYLQINATSNAYLKLTNSTTGTTINDGFDLVATGSDTGLINRESGAMFFSTSDTERMRITSGGFVGIGTNSPSYPLHVSGASDCVLFLTATNSNASGQYIANGNGAGSYPAYNLYQSGVNYWSVMMRADTNLYFQRQGGSGNTILTDGTFKTPSTISVGNATPSTSGAGITFPATQAASSDANTLDDYEEGTFTPTITATGGAFASVTYVTQLGKYTRIGDTVFITLSISWSAASGGSGDVRIAGLPFSAADGYTSMAMYQFINVQSDLDFQMRTNANTQLAPQYLKGASGVNVVNFNSGSFNKSISVAGCYKV